MRAAGIILTALTLVLLAGASEAGIFQDAGSEGNRLNREGKYDKAIKKYDEALKKTPDSDVLNYNAGTAWYNKGDYQKALGHFIKSMSTKNPAIETRSTYNAGNSQYMIGKSIEEEKNPSEAMSSFENALQYYKRAIELNDTDTDARRNYELTNKKIQQLKEKLKNQKPHDKKDEKKDDKDKGKDKDKDKDKNGNDKDKDKDKDKNGNDKDKDKDKAKDENGKDGKQPNQSTPTPHPEKTQDMKGTAPPPMSKDEADMLLEGLKQDNVPRGMIDDREKKGGRPNVLKDW
ncbi:MAG: tetratricopeptide repeat protein [Nitrospirae bacterium]|nr:tetratricopeptide repeat protein [Nitrospirota bacterium]